MATNKRQDYSRQDVYLASLARALGHPARIAIVRTLASRQGCLCGEIVDGLPLAQSSVSQHLKKLVEVGLILYTNVGSSSCYQLNPNAHTAFADVLREFIRTLPTGDNGKGCCRAMQSRTHR